MNSKISNCKLQKRDRKNLHGGGRPEEKNMFRDGEHGIEAQDVVELAWFNIAMR